MPWLAGRVRWIGYAVSALALAALGTLVDWTELVTMLRTADGGLLTIAAIALIGCYLCFAWRWRTVIGKQVRVGHRQVFAMLMAGYVANLLFPLRPGDVLRALLVDRACHIGKLVGLAGIAIERLFDLAVLSLLGLLLLLSVDIVPDGMRVALVWTVMLVATGCAMLLLLLRWSGARPMTSGRFVSGVRNMLWRLRASADQVAGPPALRVRKLLSIAFWSLAGWGCFVTAMVTCVHAVAPQTDPAAGAALTVITNLGAAVPSSPAGVGVYHALGVLALIPFGVPLAEAVAIVVLSHALAVVTQGGLGLIAMLYLNEPALLQTARKQASVDGA